VYLFFKIVRRKIKEETELQRIQFEIDGEETKRLQRSAILAGKFGETTPLGYKTNSDTSTVLEGTTSPGAVDHGNRETPAIGSEIVARESNDNLNEFAQPTTANFAAVVTDFKQQVKNVNDSSDLRLVGLKLDLEAMMNRFQQTLKEEAEEVAMGKLEVSKRSCIVEWMVEVRAVVWPESPEKIALGSPREDGVAAVATSLQAEATLLGIDRIPDVVFILDCFEWLAWCYQSLLILREPVQTSLLRKHVGQARRIKCNDEKIVKFLMAGLSRAA